MNAQRRKQLEEIVERLEGIIADIEVVKDEEDEAKENMPESLQGTDRYSAMEDNVDNLQMVMDAISAEVDNINEVIGNVC